MSAPTTAPGTIDISGTSRVSFGRLVKVEWRKMLDTRSGQWLLGITLGLLVLVSAIVLIVSATDDEPLSYSNWFLDVLLFPLSILLPVFPILAVTSEWSQRTALSTFTLESNRTRLVLAKLVAVLALAIGTVLISAVLSVVTNLLGAAIGGYDADWTIDGKQLFWTLLVQMLYFLMAFGLGALLLNSPGAVSAFYVVGMMLPFMLYMNLILAFDWAQNLLPFIDLQTSGVQLTTGQEIRPANGQFGDGAPIGATNYLQFGVATLLWVVVPNVLGFLRIKKAEVK